MDELSSQPVEVLQLSKGQQDEVEQKQAKQLDQNISEQAPCKRRKVRFSGIPKVPLDRSQDCDLQLYGEGSELEQQQQSRKNEMVAKCQEHEQETVQQNDAAQSESRKQLVERRLEGIRTLKRLLQEQQWALYDELLLVHSRFCEQGNQVFKNKTPLSKNKNKNVNQNINEEIQQQNEESSKQETLDNGAQQIWQEYLRKNQEIKDELPNFDNFEQLVVDQKNKKASTEYLIKSTEDSKSKFRNQIGKIKSLEQQLHAAWFRKLKKQDALAGLISQNTLYYIKRPYVIIGRDCSDEGYVDIDLQDSKISRRQADIELLPTGQFQLRNLGRREMIADNQLVNRGKCVVLQHYTMIEVGGVELLFVTNPVALDKVHRRNDALKQG